MKLQILSAALGLVLLLGLVPLQPAEARVFVIDDLENDPTDLCDFDTQLGTPMGAVQTGVVGVIDMIRECKFVLTTTNPGSRKFLISGIIVSIVCIVLTCYIIISKPKIIYESNTTNPKNST